MNNNEADNQHQPFDGADDDEIGRGRSGFLGKLAGARGIALLVIIGLVALSIGSVGVIASLL
ncbi:hypothetical protein [Lysinibacter cavernae]|uniref:Uncharacterized protein n=1 Tax=Lysinibacter cavernae TaxID=1640652 RepID=A0A7X5QYR9_9MICO|nr:hypothetical protein [Lysinibacter cavernae]NIH52262.1 hypothetical protein [Lysinibacter cavernae]